ncbi:DUF971 domain-containing protein [Phycisphaeraceae bacterium D3-23]
MAIFPKDIDLDRAKALTIAWSDGRVSVYPVAFLRKNSPSADARQFREELAKNPLTVLPTGAGSAGPLRAESVELVGNYAIRLVFSDGHGTGLYTWAYLREIDPAPREGPPG